MRIELKLNVGSYSVNNAYYMRNKKYNANARKYRKQFLESIISDDANILAISDLRRKFNKKKHFLRMEFYFHYPKDIISTKDGHLSRRAKDLDNVLKLPIDFLCQEKYMKDTKYAKDMNLDRIINLGIDDQFIGEILACKRPSVDDTNYLVIVIEVKELADLCL